MKVHKHPSPRLKLGRLLTVSTFILGCYVAAVASDEHRAPVRRRSSGKCATDNIWLKGGDQQLSQTLLGNAGIFHREPSSIVLSGAGRSQSVFSEEPDVPSPPLEIVPLFVSGPSTNRVDLVFFSDGYLPAEKDKFVEDARRLAEDVSKNQTFNTVQPLLNFWAAFTPSNESGIGVGGIPKDTPFGLYRDGTELRAVYYSKPEAAQAACDSLGRQCDYPILLGNDPLYGGLGGDFTVITSSILNGPLVLRHELGHSIIEVGEEYDGGFAYFGANSVHESTEPIPWKHWLSQPSESDTKSTPRVEKSVMPMQQYPWTMLQVDRPWRIQFESSGQYTNHLIRFSLSGVPDASDLRVEMDGVDVGWTPRPAVGLDRWHYDIHVPMKLDAGQHELVFSLMNGENEGVAQLCSAEVLEFGDETEFVSQPGYYGLFPTYSETNQTSYRPTNNDCLMRTVTSPNFCKVCMEGLWLHLLENVSLIDGISEKCKRHHPSSALTTTSSEQWRKIINLHLLPIAHLRAVPISFRESYTITWKKDGKLLDRFTNHTQITVDDEHSVGRYTVKVVFGTEEVRVRSRDLVSGVHYDVNERCTDGK